MHKQPMIGFPVSGQGSGCDRKRPRGDPDQVSLRIVALIVTALQQALAPMPALM
jgi:hypothetical protein